MLLAELVDVQLDAPRVDRVAREYLRALHRTAHRDQRPARVLRFDPRVVDPVPHRRLEERTENVREAHL